MTEITLLLLDPSHQAGHFLQLNLDGRFQPVQVPSYRMQSVKYFYIHRSIFDYPFKTFIIKSLISHISGNINELIGDGSSTIFKSLQKGEQITPWEVFKNYSGNLRDHTNDLNLVVISI